MRSAVRLMLFPFCGVLNCLFCSETSPSKTKRKKTEKNSTIGGGGQKRQTESIPQSETLLDCEKIEKYGKGIKGLRFYRKTCMIDK